MLCLIEAIDQAHGLSLKSYEEICASHSRSEKFPSQIHWQRWLLRRNILSEASLSTFLMLSWVFETITKRLFCDLKHSLLRLAFKLKKKVCSTNQQLPGKQKNVQNFSQSKIRSKMYYSFVLNSLNVRIFATQRNNSKKISSASSSWKELERAFSLSIAKIFVVTTGSVTKKMLDVILHFFHKIGLIITWII